VRLFWQRLRTCDRASLFGLLCVVTITTIYVLVFFNRFMYPQEGWFNAYSRRILSGQIPYRDFNLFLQPVYPYLLAALNAVFGYDFIVFRIYGIFEGMFLVSIVYLIYGRLFRPWIAAFCAIASVTLARSFNVEGICSYYYLSVALVLLSLWLLLKCFDEANPTKKFIYLASAGLACSLSFMVKQTLGFAFLFVAAVLIVLQSIKSGRGSIRGLKRFALFTVGYAVPIILFGIFLLSTHSLRQYISQVYLGTSSKGSLASILFRSIGLLFDRHWRWALLFFTVAIVSAGIYAMGSHFAKRRTSNAIVSISHYDNYMWLGVIVLPVVALVLPRLFLGYFEHTRLNGGGLFDIKRSLVYALFPGAVILSVVYLCRTLFRATSGVSWLAVALTSLTIMYVQGLSGVIEEPSTVLIFGLVLGLALSHPGFMNAAKQVALMLLVSVLMLVV
jgi:hypothetical protein